MSAVNFALGVFSNEQKLLDGAFREGIRYACALILYHNKDVMQNLESRESIDRVNGLVLDAKGQVNKLIEQNTAVDADLAKSLSVTRRLSFELVDSIQMLSAEDAKVDVSQFRPSPDYAGKTHLGTDLYLDYEFYEDPKVKSRKKILDSLLSEFYDDEKQ